MDSKQRDVHDRLDKNGWKLQRRIKLRDGCYQNYYKGPAGRLRISYPSEDGLVRDIYVERIKEAIDEFHGKDS